MGFLWEKRSEGARAPETRTENRLDAYRLRSHGIQGESGSGFDAAEEALEAAQTFVDALDGCGIGQAQVTGSAEGITGNERDPSFVEENLGKLRSVFCKSATAAA